MATTSPVKSMNFVSEEQLDKAKRRRGERVEDGTAQRDRPLHEILNENKAKKKAELDDRRKHKPPKSLDEDEVEFLNEWEMFKREKERRLALEEAQELRRFRAAVAGQCRPANEIIRIDSSAPVLQQQKVIGKRSQASRPLSSIFKVVPLPKKAKNDGESVSESSEKNSEPVLKTSDGDAADHKSPDVGITSLVSYGFDSEEDD